MAQADFGQGSKRRVLALMLAGVALLAGPAPGIFAPNAALAQNLFAPRLYVNGEAITEFEVKQRMLFMQVLRAPGNLETEAMKALVEDKLRLAEAKRLGMKLSPKDVTQAMNEFASRANLTADQLVAELQTVGISTETYRDFVTAGALWRNIVRAKFGGKVSASEAEVDRALDASSRPSALKLQVAELVIPQEPGAEQASMALAQRLAAEITSEAGFASAARQYSAAPTAQNGGRLPDWLPLANLPPAIASQLMALAPGGVTAPIQVPGAVVLFQLRDIAKDSGAAPVKVQVEWAEFTVPDDAAKIAHIRANANSCRELYGQAKGLPPEMMTVKSAPLAEVPQDVALELARLDLNQISTTLRSQPGFKRLIMLCARQAEMETPLSRDKVKERVINEKLEGLAEGYLEELRSAALIREP